MKAGYRLEPAVFWVERNQLDTKGTARLAASVERLPEMEGIMADRKKLPPAVVVASTATAVFLLDSKRQSSA
jgi:hypothetical protein